MRHRLIWSVVLAALMFAAPSRAATISFDNLTDLGGGNFSLDVNIDDVLNLASFNIDVIYDPDEVGFSATEGTFLPAQAGLLGTTFFSLPAEPLLGLNGLVASSMVGLGEGASGDGLLTTLLFTLSASSADVQFAVSLLDAALPFGQPIEVNLGNDRVTVPEPSTLLLMGVGLVGLARRRLRRT